MYTPLVIGMIFLLLFVCYGMWVAMGWWGVIILSVVSICDYFFAREPQKNNS